MLSIKEQINDMDYLGLPVYNKIYRQPAYYNNISFNAFGCMVLTFIMPFIFCDFYYSYNSISCQNNLNGVGFTLATWLQVYGFMSIIFITLIGMSLYVCKTEFTKTLMHVYQICILLFSLIWIIIGSIMFWRYLNQTGNCAKDITIYMWIRLITGIFSLISMGSLLNKNN